MIKNQINCDELLGMPKDKRNPDWKLSRAYKVNLNGNLMTRTLKNNNMRAKNVGIYGIFFEK